MDGGARGEARPRGAGGTALDLGWAEVAGVAGARRTWARRPAGQCSAQGPACESRPARPRSPLQELTGILPAEFPLKPGEKVPKVRRRIGAAYKLDEWALHREVSLPGAVLGPRGGRLCPQATTPPLGALGSRWTRGPAHASPTGASGKPCLGRNWKGRGLKGGRWASPLKGRRAAAWTGGLLGSRPVFLFLSSGGGPWGWIGSSAPPCAVRGCRASGLVCPSVGWERVHPGPHPAGLSPRLPVGSQGGCWGLPGVADRVLRQDPLSGLERQLALQLQIAEAARRLCREGNLGRQVRRQRQHAVRLEEEKLRQLQRCLGERQGRPPPGPAPGPGEPQSPGGTTLPGAATPLHRPHGPQPAPPPSPGLPPSPRPRPT